MSAILTASPPEIPPSVSTTPPPDARPLEFAAQGPGLLRRSLIFPIKLILGMVLCQGLASSLLVVGWSMRVARRAAYKSWWRRSAQKEKGNSFAEFCLKNEPARENSHWPNWICEQNFATNLRGQEPTPAIRRLMGVLRALFRSVASNYWLGLQGILNTWLLTVPPALLWWFGWYDGWNNSFAKGYEQAAVGPVISLIGIAIFIMTMLYAPMAQARQAVTGQWRSFYDFKLIRAVARNQWLFCTGFALLVVVLGLPTNILKSAPVFFPQANPGLADLSKAQLHKYLNSYFFWSTLFVFPAYILLRICGARIYASGIVELLQRGDIETTDLAPNERAVLERLSLHISASPARRHFLVRSLAWLSTRTGRIVSRIALVLVWFLFVAEVYVTEFLNYHGAHGWLNQPLIQLPWFHYLPASIQGRADEIVFAVLVLLAALVLRFLIRLCVRPREIPGAPSNPSPAINAT